jgi:fucose 4-O-acetylase-like acetyltransferase
MTQADGSQDRLYALDNLRAAMMWLGIVLHVAVIHMAGAQLLPWRDNQTTPAADLLVAFVHAFRMPVFFILAGFFVALLLAQRGAAATVRHRLRRLALPFALFWPPLFAACAVLAMLFMHRMARGTWGLDPAWRPLPTAWRRTPGPIPCTCGFCGCCSG